MRTVRRHACSANSVSPTEAQWAEATEFTVNVLASAGSLKRKYSILQPNPSKEFEETLYPVWVPPLDDGSTVSGWNDHWSGAAQQSRTAAQWIATLLGAVLTVLLGSAPILGLGSRGGWAIGLLAAAAVTAGVVVVLVLRVMTPTIVSISDVLQATSTNGTRARGAEAALQKLTKSLESKGGVALPAGIESIAEMVGRIRLEEATLEAIAKKLGSTTPPQPDVLRSAQTDRGQWFSYLQQQTQELLALAQFQLVRTKAQTARRWGVWFAAFSVVAAASAYLLPVNPSVKAVSANAVATYALSSRVGSSTLKKIGPNCGEFLGAVVGHTPPKTGVGQWDDVSVLQSTTCSRAYVKVLDRDLLRLDAG